MKTVYRFSSGETGPGRYPWVFSIDLHWEDGPDLCPICHFNEGRYAGIGYATVEGGREWPDMLGVGSAGPSKLFSNRVVERLQAIPSLKNKIEFGQINLLIENSKCNAKPPKYFYLNVACKVPVDINLSHSRILKQCSACHRILKLDPLRPFYPDLQQWCGTPIFEMGYSRGRALYCSEEIKQLAERDGWTNFEFALVATKP